MSAPPKIRHRSPWRTRSIARRSGLVAASSTVAVATLLTTLVLGTAVRSPTADVRRALDADTPTAVTLVVGADAKPDRGAQDAAVHARVARELAPTPLIVQSTTLSAPFPVSAGTESRRRTAVALVSNANLRARVTAVTGVVSTSGPNRVAIDTGGARALGVTVGDHLVLVTGKSTVDATISGIWRERDPHAPEWAAAPPGGDGADVRLITGHALAASFGSTLERRWAIAPDPRRLHADDLARLVTGFRALPAALGSDGAVTDNPVTTGGSGPATAATLLASVDAVRAVAPAPLSLAAVAAAVAIALLARLVAAARTNETRLLRARGASVGRLVRADVAEWAIVGMVGAVGGGLLAQVALTAAGPPVNAVDTVLAPAVVLLGTIVIAAVVGALAASGASGETRPDPGRARAVVGAALVVLAVAASAVTLWRFLVFGAVGDGRTDPIGIAAPAVTIGALAILALVALPPLARAAERPAARRPEVTAVLAARRVARDVGLLAAPVALVVLAASTIALASGFAGTSSTFLVGSSRAVTGSDVAVTAPPSTVGSGTILADRIRSVRGVHDTDPVLSTTGTAGETPVSIVGVRAAALPRLVDAEPPLFDAGTVSRALAGERLSGLRLPTGAKRMTLDVTATGTMAESDGSGPSPTVTTTLWLGRPDGAVITRRSAPVHLHATAASSTTPSTTASPTTGPSAPVATDVSLPTDGRFTLLAVDARVDSGEELTDVTVAIVPHTVDGATLPAVSGWRIRTEAFGTPAAATSGLGFRLGDVPANVGAGTRVRLMPAGTTRVPVVVSAVLATTAGLSPGDTLEIDGATASFPAVVRGVTAVVPGTSGGAAVLADLATVQTASLVSSASLPAATDAWVRTMTPDATTRRLADRVASTVRIATADTPGEAELLGVSVLDLRLGALGCLLFAFVAFAAGLALSRRSRRDEAIVLRALGLSTRQQRASRLAETLGVSVYALMIGAVAGTVLAVVLVNVLGRLAVPTAPVELAIRGVFGPVEAAVGLALLLAGLAVVILADAAVVRRAASRGVADR